LFHLKLIIYIYRGVHFLAGILLGPNFFLGQFFYEEEVPDYDLFRSQQQVSSALFAVAPASGKEVFPEHLHIVLRVADTTGHIRRLY